jgi:glycine oxidase
MPGRVPGNCSARQRSHVPTFDPRSAFSPRSSSLFYNAIVKTWDVIVIGGGIIGLTLARELRKRNLSVLVVERGEAGHEASRAAAGMLADSGDETPAELRPLASASALMYPEFAHELEDESGSHVDLRSEGTIVFESDRHGQRHSSRIALANKELLELEPWLRPPSAHAFLLEERSVDPRALVEAGLKACKHRGVDIASGAAVVSIDLDQGRAAGVTTAKTKYCSSTVVNCAGAWAGQLPPHHFSTRPVKGQMLAVALPTRTFLRHVIRSSEVYLVPRSSGRLLIGATVEEAGFDKRTDAATIHRLHQAALGMFPGLEQARILEDWAGLRPGTPDGLPILGATPTPGYFVATGHFRDGILLAPITARVMAQIVAGESPDHDVSRFSSRRFSVEAAP